MAAGQASLGLAWPGLACRPGQAQAGKKISGQARPGPKKFQAQKKFQARPGGNFFEILKGKFFKVYQHIFDFFLFAILIQMASPPPLKRNRIEEKT